MSIQSEITRITDAKNDIISSLQNKGSIIESGASIDTIAPFIDALSSGGFQLIRSATFHGSGTQFIMSLDGVDMVNDDWMILTRIQTIDGTTAFPNMVVSNSNSFGIGNTSIIVNTGDGNLKGVMMVRPTYFWSVGGVEHNYTFPTLREANYCGFYKGFSANFAIAENSVMLLYKA